MISTRDLESENIQLKKELFRLQSLLQARKDKEERDKKKSSPYQSQDENLSSDEELVTRSGLRLVPMFDEDKCVEIVAQVVDDIPKLKKKKKKRKSKKSRAQRKAQKKPVMSAALELEDLFDCSIELTDANKVKLREGKLMTLNAVRKFTPVELINEITSVEKLLEKELEKGEFNAFYLVNLGAVVEKYIEWTTNLPRVQPLYAMKSNPDINIIRTLHALGAGFDCASKQELTDALSVGTLPENIIYANPCKGPEHIAFAKEKQLDFMTFDSLAELQKIHGIHPAAKLVLRILPDDSKSIMPFGTKFGASMSDCKKLIEKCRELNLQLVGVSFHVGSGCFSSSAFVDAVLLAREVFDMAEQYDFNLNLLDLGGGWPGVDTSTLSFVDIAKDLAPVLDQYFPPHVRIIAEPGRFFCTACYTLAVSIISRRERWVKPKTDNEEEEPTKEVLYYLSDGLYGSFNNIVFDHARPLPVPMKKDENTQRSSLFGPTCDSIDVICKDIDLPELEIGDWLYFLNMGAYTLASASSFNGFKPPNAKYLMYTGDDSLSVS